MPSIGKDLAKIRTAMGLTLQDIQATIKIPMITLEKIENGSIFEDSEHGYTYVRSFIRSYGRALKMDDDVMINGLNQQETGNYNHLLWNYFEANRQSAPINSKFTFDDVEQAGVVPGPDSAADTKDVEAATGKKAATGPEPTVDDADSEDKSETDIPAVTEAPPNKVMPAPKSDDVNWADMGLKFIETKESTPVWMFSALILAVLAAVIGYFIYAGDFFSSNSTPGDDATVATSIQDRDSGLLDLDTPAPVSDNGVQDGVLDEILYITVYAAYDRLEPVRVWSDEKPRMDPYWLEQGLAMNFDFRDTIRIRGAYSNMILFKNGQMIENAIEENYNPDENYIELTRDYFSSDPNWSTVQPFQLPDGVSQPDSVMLRPTF